MAGPSIFTRLVPISLAACSAACAATSAVAPSATKQSVEMDPMLVRSKPDPLTGLDGYDAPQLLAVGNQLFEAKDYDRAVQVFERLPESFPESEHVPAAIYNSGLAFEQLEEYAEALARFARIMAEHPSAVSYKDAHFRASLALGKLGRWREVADTFWAIRQIPSLTAMDELEARVGQGVAMFMLDDHATAERELMSAIRFFEDQEEKQYLPADYWIGQARFYLGEISAREFEKITLSTPKPNQDAWVDMMGKELEEKCEILLRAQNNFIRAIRVGHTGWATAAGFRIGSLYERLYQEMMEVPVPPGLDEEATEYYRSELKKRVGVLVMKAIKIYEASLAMAQRIGEQNEWVERTSQSLERMKSLYLGSLEPTEPS